MIIRNLSNQVQELSVSSRGDRRLTYSIYINAKSDLDIDNSLVILNLSTLESRGILKKVINTVIPESQEPAEETLNTEDSSNICEESTQGENPGGDIDSVITEDESPEDEENPTEGAEEGSCKCPHCGKEFASSRSLNMHINRTHKE